MNRVFSVWWELQAVQKGDNIELFDLEEAFQKKRISRGETKNNNDEESEYGGEIGRLVLGSVWTISEGIIIDNAFRIVISVISCIF